MVGRVLLRLAVVGALLGTVVVIGPAWYVKAVSDDRTSTVQDVPAQPVALVLGAEVYADGQPSRYLRARLDVAYELFEAGKVRAILVSGDNGTRFYNETDGMRDYLIEKGVPAAKVVGDYAGFDTYDSCVRARDVFGVDELTIVTQDYHLGRAVAICRQVGVDAVGVADESVRTRYPAVWAKGAGREWVANLKMEWDVATARQPQSDPFDASLLAAAEQ